MAVNEQGDAPLLAIPKYATEMVGVPFFIGLFVQEWSKQERMLGNLIAALSGQPYEDVIEKLLDGATEGYAKQLTKAAKALPSGHPAQPYITRVLAQHLRLRELRHDIIHGWWASMGPGHEYLLRRKKRGVAETMRSFSLAELTGIWRETQTLGLAILNATRVSLGQEPV